MHNLSKKKLSKKLLIKENRWRDTLVGKKKRGNMTNLRVWYDKDGEPMMPLVKEALKDVYGLATSEELLMDPVESAYNPSRNQYDASKLLNYLISVNALSEYLAIWIIHDDLYVEGMNFVFGVAHTGSAAVISTHRLDSPELVKKETIHEMGHVMGLKHCTNYCVMQFSNSLYEAKKKPAQLCAKCRALL
jgi:archaemetzincin